MQPNETPTASAPEQKKSSFGETVRFIIVSLVIVFGIRYFIAQPFIVSGESMVPTFQNGEYLIVDELSYRFTEPSRNDVVIIRYPLDPSKFFIKRIIGLPGETLHFDGTRITVTPADGGTPIELDESFIKNQNNTYLTVTLKEDEYFVLGDNRPASSDSRVWGTLPRKDIIGTPVLRLLPISHLGWRPGATVQN